MMNDRLTRNRPLGQTSGTEERPAQQLAAPVLIFNLAEEIERLKREEAWRRTDQNAKTLVKEPDLRIVLVVMKQKGRLLDHHAPTRISIQTISGSVLIHLPGQTVRLPAGSVMALEGDVAHDVEALEESAFLLTISWPNGQSSTSPPANCSALKSGRPSPSPRR